MSKGFFTLDELVSATNGSLYNINSSLLGIYSIVTDSRSDCSNSLFLAIRGKQFDGHAFVDKAISSGASIVCVDSKFYNEAIDCSFPMLVVDDTTRAYQDLALFHRRRLEIKVIGITGSSGKTSTKDIMRSVMVEAYGEDGVYSTIANTNNHIGVPLNLLNLKEHHKVAIIEMGSNHCGEIEALSRTAEPDIAIVTSIGNCHMEFFETLANVAQEKGTIFKHLAKDGTAIIPAHSRFKSILAESVNCGKICYFGNATYGVYLGGDLFGSRFELCFSSGEKRNVKWRLHGEHQMRNALAVVAAAEELGLDCDTIVRGLSNCTLSGMRMRMREIDGVSWVNDAYNANPDSMIATLNWLYEFVNQDKIVLILGDMLELGKVSLEKHISVVSFACKKFPNSRIITVGGEMQKALNAVDPKVLKNVTHFDDSQSAIIPVRSVIKSGDIVFLKGSRGVMLEVIENGFS